MTHPRCSARAIHVRHEPVRQSQSRAVTDRSSVAATTDQSGIYAGQPHLANLRIVVVRGGVEAPTFRFSGVLSPLRPRTSNTYASPAHRRWGWSMGLYGHGTNRAAVCRVVPFGPWASCGGAPRTRTCGLFVGLIKTRTAATPGVRAISGSRPAPPRLPKPPTPALAPMPARRARAPP